MRIGGILLATLLSAPGGPPGSIASEPRERPNILLIVSDDQGYADLGVHGCRTIPTPNLDSLAANGVRCSSGYVSSPVCGPSRAGLMTGRYPNRFGYEHNPPGPRHRGSRKWGLPAEERTLAEHLRDLGYATGLVGKWHLGHTAEMHPLRRGFDEFFGFVPSSQTYFQPEPASEGRGLLRGETSVGEPEYLTRAFGREARDFIRRHRDEPWFLFLSFNAVHTPLQAPETTVDEFAELPGERRRVYAAMLAEMDAAVGAVLSELRGTGQEEETLVLFLSDNGGAFSNASDNAPLRGAKGTVWEGGIRVPFLVQWKGTLPAGRVFDHPVIQLDVLPTALAAAGVRELPEGIDGTNLLPHLAGEVDRPPHDVLFWRFADELAVRRGNWKLVRAEGWRDEPVEGPPGARDALLVDLATDHGERTDLARQHPEVVAELAALWTAWDAGLPPPAWDRPPRAFTIEEKRALRESGR